MISRTTDWISVPGWLPCPSCGVVEYLMPLDQDGASSEAICADCRLMLADAAFTAAQQMIAKAHEVANGFEANPCAP